VFLRDGGRALVSHFHDAGVLHRCCEFLARSSNPAGARPIRPRVTASGVGHLRMQPQVPRDDDKREVFQKPSRWLAPLPWRLCLSACRSGPDYKNARIAAGWRFRRTPPGDQPRSLSANSGGVSTIRSRQTGWSEKDRDQGQSRHPDRCGQFAAGARRRTRRRRAKPIRRSATTPALRSPRSSRRRGEGIFSREELHSDVVVDTSIDAELGLNLFRALTPGPSESARPLRVRPRRPLCGRPPQVRL